MCAFQLPEINVWEREAAGSNIAKWEGPTPLSLSSPETSVWHGESHGRYGKDVILIIVLSLTILKFRREEGLVMFRFLL